MNNLIKKLRHEINNPNSKEVDVHSYYKYKLEPKIFDHNKDFVPKYDNKKAFEVESYYNGNKYNLDRPNNDYTIHYKSKDFIPDSYYEFNLKNTNHKKMMLNNLETENEIGNDFNRRIRQSESTQPIEELKTEDDERTENLKLLLEQFNKENNNITTIEEQEELKDETHDKLKNIDNNYHKPVINKVVEHTNFNNQLKKIEKLGDKISKTDILEIKKNFSRLSKLDKIDAIEGLDKYINEHATKIIQKAGKKYIVNKKNINKILPPHPPIKLLQDSEELPMPPLQTFYKKSINEDKQNVENPLKKTAAQISEDALLQKEGESDKKFLRRVKTNLKNKQKTKISNEMGVNEVIKQSKQNEKEIAKYNYFIENLDNK